MGSSPALAPAPPAKNVVVYRNGDPFFRGRRVVVNQRRFLTFEAFLNELTRSVGAAVAVRKLYTARQGRRVARLGDLRDGCQYVAAGSERFKSLDVFRNGDLLSPPFRLPLPGSALPEQDALLTLLTEKVTVRGGAVRKLCRLDGAQVCEAEELVNGGYYVAVGAEKYQNLPYLELLVPQAPVYRTPRNHPHGRRRNSCERLDNRRAQTTEATEKDKIPVASPPLQKPPRKPHPQDEESLFYARPVRAGQNRKNNTNVQHWPADQGVVYKAKDPRRETRGAREVKEDEHTKVEVPIDQSGSTLGL
ncbi:doublecortin domain-containing protein 2B [Nothoprocta perdicaria]|uniref:doublecortin domain-containing protein 2B n=1 Tax=Nothoprocta perdicaria TaxID=30464 RepID=UPI000E1C3ACC|nr:doublecortin domain-containing protein 2B [Nothoprocta perdicaria]